MGWGHERTPAAHENRVLKRASSAMRWTQEPFHLAFIDRMNVTRTRLGQLQVSRGAGFGERLSSVRPENRV